MVSIMKPEISVIIPVYNRGEFLIKTINSVLSQTYKNFELIIVDDGSTENIKKIINSFAQKIIYCKQANKGPASARNMGIDKSKGKFIAFLDSDDCWHKDKLLFQAEAMRNNPSYLISHTQETWYRNNKLLNQKRKHKKCNQYIFDNCLPICMVSMSTVMVRKKLFTKIGLFDENLPCCEDYDFWLRISAKYPFLLIDKALTSKYGGRIDQVSYIHKTGIDTYRIQAIKKLLDKTNTLTIKQRHLTIEELKRKCTVYGMGCLKRNKIKEGNYYLELSEKYLL
jgi:glycosyltransferase involved in cell wall biosynthesis